MNKKGSIDINTVEFYNTSEEINALFASNIDTMTMDKQEAKRFSEDTQHRAGLIRWMKGIVSAWLVTVIIIIGTSGFLLKISDAVLVTLLATTTANVLGLSAIILNGLFKNR